MEIMFDQDYLKTTKLFFATPCYGGVCNGIFARCLVDLSHIAAQVGFPLQIYMLFNESLITRARNYSVDEFMRSDATHFMFVDADVGFNPMDIITLMLLQRHDKENDYDIIGGAYPKKTISWEKIKMAVDKGFADKNPEALANFVGDYVFNPKYGNNILISEPCEVLEIGTGFMMVKRSAFELFCDKHPELLYRPDHVRTEHFDGTRQITQYFQAEIDQINFRSFYEEKLNDLIKKGAPVDAITLKSILEAANIENSKESNRYLSEDYWFCQEMQKLDLKTWLCPWMRLNHTGSWTFGGSLADIAALGASPTADLAELQKYKNKK
jgi:hypothetical protein